MKHQLKRTDKIALLSSAMHGKPKLLVQYKQRQEKDVIYMILATELKTDDRITAISIGRQPMPDMSRIEFENWKERLGANGALVVCLICPERTF